MNGYGILLILRLWGAENYGWFVTHLDKYPHSGFWGSCGPRREYMYGRQETRQGGNACTQSSWVRGMCLDSYVPTFITSTY